MMSMDYPAHTFVSLFYDGDDRVDESGG